MDLLTALLDRFRAGEEPDYGLMCEVLEYMIDYSDQVHHPSEELIFERLFAVSGENPDLLRRVMRQHEQLSQLNRRFRESLEGIMHEEVLPRDEVELQGREMLSLLREHIELENTRAFPFAAAQLTAEDWADIETRVPQAQDPVFGQADPQRFRALYARLKDQLGE